MHILEKTLNDSLAAHNNPLRFTPHYDSLWCETDDQTLFLALAELLRRVEARVCMISAYAKDEAHELVYHFDCGGVMANVKVYVADRCVFSITPLFKSADWTERELSEIYGITLQNHPNPQRLFLDDSIDRSVLDEYYSLSSMMNGRVSETLWNKVKAQKEARHG